MPRKTADERWAEMTLAQIYPLYINKIVKKGRTEEELLQVIKWLTGYTKKQVQKHIDDQSTFKTFFAKAKMNPKRKLITGMVCGHRVEDTEHPLTKKGRQLDRLIDELARGKKMESILRS